jgi:hypothetical protein
MLVKLPKPFMYENIEYNEAEISIITGGAIAEAQKFVENNPYKAMLTIISKSIDSIEGQKDRTKINEVISKMPYKSSEHLLVKIIMQEADTDKIEGVYKCPVCGEKKYCIGEQADHLSDLKIKTLNDINDLIEISLEPAISINEEDENIKDIFSITLNYPSLENCINAYEKIGGKNETKLQFAIYTEALMGINGNEIDRKIRTRWGNYIFENMSRPELIKIGETVNNYGIETEIMKTCKECGQEWQQVINTANFFALALRSK